MDISKLLAEAEEDHGKVIAEGTQDALIEQSQSHTSIRLKFDKEAASYMNDIKQISHVMAINKESENEISLLVSGNGNSQKEVIHAVMGMDLGLVSFDVTKPNLEQVFLKLTGRGLRD